MTLIKSISGIRGTIGGKIAENLTPPDIMKFASAYGTWVKETSGKDKIKVVVGRDGRISGPMVERIVIASLNSIGADVINLGMASTPTTEVAVEAENADGGIIITASHNPKIWNALKLLNKNGEFLDADEGKRVLEIADNEAYTFVDVDNIGNVTNKDYDDYHIKKILDLDLVDADLVREAGFKVAVDGINSVGGIIVPKLLQSMGVAEIYELNCEPNGEFAHVAEPLPENIKEVADLTKNKGLDLAFVVDPDVDRLVIVNEDGSMFGEEYTLVAVADYVLQNTPGNTVSNMSSSRALRVITEKHGGSYTSSAVGEVNVVAKMRKTNAIIGGEGNGGVIYPACHSGRDALVGIALFLTYLAKSGKKCSELRAQFPDYYISKNKIELTPEIDVDAILESIKMKYTKVDVTLNTIDGVKIEFANEWVHLRKSNTEPIIRIYSESSNKESAEKLANMIIDDIKSFT